MMRTKRQIKILIFFCKETGHESLAQGLKHVFEKNYGEKVDIKLIDPGSRNSLAALYDLMCVVWPGAWNFYFKATSTWLGRYRKLINYEKKVGKIISDQRPDLIVAADPIYPDESKKAMAKLGINCPVISFVSDPFSIHPIFWSRHADLIMCYDKKAVDLRKVPEAVRRKIISFGWPLRDSFVEGINANSSILAKIGLKKGSFTILFGGSASGKDSLERLAVLISRLKFDFQAVFLCGENKILRHSLKALFANKKNFVVLGTQTASKMYELTKASDLIVGKAGPNPMFERIVCGTVQLATPPILVQEVGNRDFIEKENIGFLSKNTPQTIKILRNILSNKNLLLEKRQNMARVKKQFLLKNEKGIKDLKQWVDKRLNLS